MISKQHDVTILPTMFEHHFKENHHVIPDHIPMRIILD